MERLFAYLVIFFLGYLIMTSDGKRFDVILSWMHVYKAHCANIIKNEDFNLTNFAFASSRYSCKYFNCERLQAT